MAHPSLDFWRQSGIVAPEALARFRVTVIGAGGIGSPLVLALSKMGVGAITVFDDDTVATHNIPNQLYRHGDVGKKKVAALCDIVRVFAGTNITARDERYTNARLEGIVISAVDSMRSRADVWKGVAYNLHVPCYIDARMAAEVGQILTVRPCDPEHIEWYEKTLYTDTDAHEAPCTERAIVYNVFVLGGLIAAQVKKLVAGAPLRREIFVDLITTQLVTSEREV